MSNAFFAFFNQTVDSVSGLFILLVNMGMSATLVAVAVILARLLLRRAPKALSYVLWLAVGARLVLPVSFRLPVSLLGLMKPRLEQTTGLPEYIPYELAGGGTTARPILPPVPGVEVRIPQTPAASADPVQILTAVLCGLWICGMAALLIYSVVSYVKALRRVREAVLLTGPAVDEALARFRLSRRLRVYESDRIASPFVCGFLRPRIYLRTGLSGPELTYILTHELVHVKRFDYLVKPFAFLLLLLHWYNPVLWIAFRLFSADQEMSCDERVMKLLGGEIRADYSQSLLNIAAGRRPLGGLGLPLGTPLAFGESGVKGRIQNILHYKKPAFWVLAAAVAAVAALLIFLLADPMHTRTDPAAPTGTPAQELQAVLTGLSTAPNPLDLPAVYTQRILPLEMSGLLDEPFHSYGRNGDPEGGDGLSAAPSENIPPDSLVRYADSLSVLTPGPNGSYDGAALESVCKARFHVDEARIRQSGYYDPETETYARPAETRAVPAIRSIAGPSLTEIGPAYYLAYFDSEEAQEAAKASALYQVILDDSLLAYVSGGITYPPAQWPSCYGWRTGEDGTAVYQFPLAINGMDTGVPQPRPDGPELTADAASFYRQFVEPLCDSGILALGFDSVREGSPAETEEIPPDSLLAFYALTKGWEDMANSSFATVAAATLEQELQARFYVSTQWLRSSTFYDAGTERYKLPLGAFEREPRYSLYKVRGPGAGQLGMVYTVAYFANEADQAADEPAAVYEVTLEDVGYGSYWPRYLAVRQSDTDSWLRLDPAERESLERQIAQLEAERDKAREAGGSGRADTGDGEAIAAIQAEIERVIRS